MLKKRPKTQIRGAVDKGHEWRQRQGIKKLFWLAFGVLVCLGLGVFLSLSPTLHQKEPSQPQDTSFAPLAMDYEFYTLLPKQKFVSDDGQEAPTPTVAKLVVDDTQRVIEGQSPYYVLQVRSYDNAYDADQKRAQVVMAGVEAEVIKGSNKQGDMVYQVVSAPFVSDEQTLMAYERLRASGIDSLVIHKIVE